MTCQKSFARKLSPSYKQVLRLNPQGKQPNRGGGEGDEGQGTTGNKRWTQQLTTERNREFVQGMKMSLN